MNRALTLLCAAAVAAGAWAAAGPAERVGALTVPLPPLARAGAPAPDGQMWQQTGELGGSLAHARGELMAALGAHGWALSKTIVMGRLPARSELMVWTLRKRRILFLVWEKEAGTCGFAWGEDK